MIQESLSEVMEYLDDLKSDNTVSKNVREKINQIVLILIENQDISLKINKAMQSLDDISEDISLPSYTRTQIWNIVSMLESIN